MACLQRSPDPKRDWLEHQPILRHCGSAELELLGRTVEWSRVAPGTVLQREGVSSAALYVVCEGVGLCSHLGVPLAMVGPNDLVGDLSILRGARATYTVVAADSMVVLGIERLAFLKSLFQVPGLARGLHEAVASRSTLLDGMAPGKLAAGEERTTF